MPTVARRRMKPSPYAPIAITNDIAWRFTPAEGLRQLMGNPVKTAICGPPTTKASANAAGRGVLIVGDMSIDAMPSASALATVSSLRHVFWYFATVVWRTSILSLSSSP